MSVIIQEFHSGVFHDVEDLIEHYSYGSFGKLLKISDANDVDVTDNPIVEPYLTYTAREFEIESGLYYYRARWYNADAGSFVEKDPFRGILFAPQTFINNYNYTRNNPVNLSDPLGKYSPLSTVVNFLSGSIEFVALPLFAGVNSAEEANKNNGSVFQISLAFVFNAAMVGAASYASGAVFGAVLAAGGIFAAPLAVVAASLTTGVIATFQNAGNQAIMGRSVNWKRAVKAGSQAAIISAVTFGIGERFNLGGLSKAITNGAGGGLGTTCADSGISPMTKDEVEEMEYYPSRCEVHIRAESVGL